MPRLILQTAEGLRVIDLRPVNTLGRLPSSSIQVLDSQVSEEHCVITLRSGRWFLRELDSFTGTYLNDERVRGEAPLKHGDEIRLGTTKVRFEFGSWSLVTTTAAVARYEKARPPQATKPQTARASASPEKPPAPKAKPVFPAAQPEKLGPAQAARQVKAARPKPVKTDELTSPRKLLDADADLVAVCRPPDLVLSRALDRSPSDVADERDLLRFPSITPQGAVRAGQTIRILVDLLLDDTDRSTESVGVHVNGLPPDWSSIEVSVSLLSTAVEFASGGNAGTIRVRRGKPSVPCELVGTVRGDVAAGSAIEVVASFLYQGRFCGGARRPLRVELAPTFLEPPPGMDGCAAFLASSSPPGGVARGGLHPSAPAAAHHSALAPRAAAVAGPRPRRPSSQPIRGALIAIDPSVEAPLLTVEIHRLDPAHPGVLYWVLHLGRQVEGVPGRLSGSCDLGAEPAKFLASLIRGCAHLAAGDPTAYFRGLGELLYDRAPACFRETYCALRKACGAGFAIQLISDDPNIPWELMWPSDVGGADMLALEHPIARWLLDHQTTMTGSLGPGGVVSVVPDYARRTDVSTLPGAQREAAQLCRRFGAIPIAARRARVMDLLRRGLALPVAVLHFAGHGRCTPGEVEASCILLEDGELHMLEVRSRAVTLGRKDRTVVVLNACEVGAMGDVLGSVAGWAEAFARGQFGGLLAPLWPVLDADAAPFVLDLLEEVLHQGKPMGAALRSVRRRYARVSTTPFSYVYFGDVMARFRDGGQRPRGWRSMRRLRERLGRCVQALRWRVSRMLGIARR